MIPECGGENEETLLIAMAGEGVRSGTETHTKSGHIDDRNDYRPQHYRSLEWPEAGFYICPNGYGY
jgi:hypothetical protein